MTKTKNAPIYGQLTKEQLLACTYGATIDPKNPQGIPAYTAAHNEDVQITLRADRSVPRSTYACSCKHDVSADQDYPEPEDSEEDSRHSEHDEYHLEEDQEDVHGNSDLQPDWDEEATLIALILDEEEEARTDDKASVVDRLRPAFEAQDRKAKQDIKDIILPVINSVKHAHSLVTQKIDPALLDGLDIFDRNSKMLEDYARREFDEVTAAYMKTKASSYQGELEVLFTQMDETFTEGDQVFKKFEDAVNPLVQRIRTCANSTPGDMERTISNGDKEIKALGTENKEKIKEKLLRSILEQY
ncbi:hypothetical protein BV22DRAFT_1045929 [Leucogyrophana mollusca]|uniref:Uncharacterized protein n=1 Tax=Leucogyrophana mollusca TaxID=85980 RepID=A0ACB8BN78_9AGAM|nr:hypothetical protein BV22DRAFT_1045929 [Leucogyrophana mollusca]